MEQIKRRNNKSSWKSKSFLGEVVFFVAIAGIPLLQFCFFYIGVNAIPFLCRFKVSML